MTLNVFSQSVVRERSWSLLVDGLVFAIVAACIYGAVEPLTPGVLPA